MTCDDYRSQYLAGFAATGPGSHLSRCPECRAALPGLDRLRSWLADPVVWEEPRWGADRLVAQIEAEGVRRPATGRRLLLPLAAGGLLLAALLFVVALVVRAPDWEVPLLATPNAPGATAEVAGWNEASGTRMHLEVSGLPPSGGGAYYEIWLTAPDGRHVSAGSFRGSGSVTAWAGVPRSEFPRIWITLEPADDDLSPSSMVVFDTEE